MLNKTKGIDSLTDKETLARNAHALNGSRLGRRSFLKRLGWGGTALLPASGLLAGQAMTKADAFGGGLTSGGTEIQHFELWQDKAGNAV